MSSPYVNVVDLQTYPLWQRLADRPLSIEFELTARCNNDCRHCYINVPAGDARARRMELSTAEVLRIADEAVEVGVLWCLLTGGEPLLREDFADLYVRLKRKGLLVSLFTNACLITRKHVDLFMHYPPRQLEITVYGVTEATYEAVTRRAGSYAAFRRGLNRLLRAGIKVNLKGVALRANQHELDAIRAFCERYSAEPFRFDPLLHLRYDGDAARNAEIRAERLPAEEIVRIEHADADRVGALVRNCHNFLLPDDAYQAGPADLLYCGAGLDGVTVGADGRLRLCSSLCHDACVYDLRAGSLREAIDTFIPRVRAMAPTQDSITRQCLRCPYLNLCMWCPAHAHLECGQIDQRCEYFCQVATARAEALRARVEAEREGEVAHV